MTLKSFTKQTLFEEWNVKYKSLKNQIKSLKEKRDMAETDEDRETFHWEISILCERANLIHYFLADISMLIE